MAAIDALLELRVDVHRHLRVGMADLTHYPLHVEVVGEQRDRDVGAAQRVRRGVGQGRQAARRQSLARQVGRLADDLRDPLAVEAAALQVRDEVVLRPGRSAHAAQPIEVLDHGLDQIGTHLHLADAGFGLGVRNAEARPVRIVQPELADLQVAKLARADAAATKDLADDAAADVATADLGAETAQMEADGRFRHAEPLGDLARSQSLGGEVGDQRGGRSEVDRRASGRQRHVLRGGGVEQAGQLVHLQEGALGLGDVDAHPLPPRRVEVDVSVLDGIVKDRAEGVEHLADRSPPEWDGPPPATVANIGARLNRLTQFLRLAQQVSLEGEAQIVVDLVEVKVAEEGQQMAAQPPAIVAGGVLGDRLGAEDAVDLCVEPPPGVIGKEGNILSGNGFGETSGRLGALP